MLLLRLPHSRIRKQERRQRCTQFHDGRGRRQQDARAIAADSMVAACGIVNLIPRGTEAKTAAPSYLHIGRGGAVLAAAAVAGNTP